LAVWLQPLKARNRPNFLACRWCETYCWKTLEEGYNFTLDLISIRGLGTKLWGPKLVGVPILAISRLPRQNAIWMWASWRGREYIIRGKVVASPKSGPWSVLCVRICLWLVLVPKLLQLCTNHLVFGLVQVCVSSWCLSLFLVPSQSSNTPFYPQSAASQGMCFGSLLFRCFKSRLTFESIKELGSLSSSNRGLKVILKGLKRILRILFIGEK